MEGSHYTEPVHDYESVDDFDCMYKITSQDQDWANPTADGKISWERESSCNSHFEEENEQWQNRLLEVTTLNCNMITRSLCCVSIEIRDLPTYDGLR